jgi:hypothetical protein
VASNQQSAVENNVQRTITLKYEAVEETATKPQPIILAIDQNLTVSKGNSNAKPLNRGRPNTSSGAKKPFDSQSIPK